MRTFSVRGVEIGEGRTYVVAEMAWSHDGKKELALDIARGAGRAGADCLSIHITNLDAYMVPHYGSGEGRVSAGKDATKIFRYLCDVNIRDEWWGDIVGEARKAGLAIAIMPNDEPSLGLARSLEPDIYVLSAACFVEEGFVRAVAREKKPILLRVGGATLGEMEQVLGWLGEEGLEDLVMLFGQQNYPTKIENTDLLKLRTLRDVFDCPVGLADHIDADDPVATQIPFMALPLGACMIEKHITHDRSKKGEDFESALNPDEFADFVGRLRKAEAALGNPYFHGMSESQRKYRLVARKRIVAARALEAGHTLEAADLACKRADQGEYPDRLPMLVGRTVTRDLQANEGISWDVVG
jgi:sialic acid synthase SpsE